MRALLAAAAAALVLAGAGSGVVSAGAPPRLDVPFVPQTEALCGGAAAAMVFRYWGDVHADVRPFAPLVDARAGGITGARLSEAIARRNWRTHRFGGSRELVLRHLASGEPLILLLADGALRYHYVVAIAADDEALVAHDPARGPARRIAWDELLRRWEPSGNWTLLVRPPVDHGRPMAELGTQPRDARPEVPATADRCETMASAAVDEVARRGYASADEVFGAVARACPGSAAPWRERAGVRFAEKRWSDAAALAGEAVARDARDDYAWNLLAASRFMQDDTTGALEAWNHVGRPRADVVQVSGVRRMDYAVVAEVADLPTGDVITPSAFVRAARRVDALPGVVGSRVGLRPGEDGFAKVDVAVVEPAVVPQGPVEWAAAGARALVDREVAVDAPASARQGAMWSARYRWWENRPAVSVSLAVPRLGRVGGLWTVEAGWEAQTYATAAGSVRETRSHAGLGVADWVSGTVRLEGRAGVEVWNQALRTAYVGGAVEYRSADSRVGAQAAFTGWQPLGAGGSRFGSVSAELSILSSTLTDGLRAVGVAGVDFSTTSAPLALRSGAGTGHARDPLLRAHPLLQDGIISGPVFGRRTSYATGELQRWWSVAATVPVAVAAFTDAAHAEETLTGGSAWQWDAGVGFRVKAPGRRGVLRIDYAVGLRDGSRGFSVGWTVGR